ncbi:MAG: hypothetical protein HQK83_16335 [Fibrobacteria bacterium]|nr:hypothetical protein [Fibrobacteria bacterium]
MTGNIFLRSLQVLLILSLLWTNEVVCAWPDSGFIFGVTIDDPWTQRPAIKAALAGHAIKPTVRIVFDEWIAASEYVVPVENIKEAAYVMGEILDSYYVPNYSVKQYKDRTKEYLDQFEDVVDIWEVGNEINGDWLGNIDSVRVKVTDAFNQVEERGLESAINLYYNEPCYYGEKQYEMFTWVNNNISQNMRDNLDYVFFSYYEDDCYDVLLTEEEWQVVFDSLHVLFPNAKIGFGEVGTDTTANKATYMKRYYTLNITTENYVGGYFWWYYRQDCIPRTKALWDSLNILITPDSTPVTLYNHSQSMNPVSESFADVFYTPGLSGGLQLRVISTEGETHKKYFYRLDGRRTFHSHGGLK